MCESTGAPSGALQKEAVLRSMPASAAAGALFMTSMVKCMSLQGRKGPARSGFMRHTLSALHILHSPDAVNQVLLPLTAGTATPVHAEGKAQSQSNDANS